MEETQDHLGQGPEVQVSLEHVRTRSIRGILTLTFRTFLLNIIALVAQGILWAYLSPQEFGVFFVVNAVVNFLVYFSDVGLAASLVQKKEEPTELEYRTTFTIQQFLVVLLLLLLFLFTPYIRSHYSLDTAGIYLLYAVAVSFFLSSLKSIPSVRLERKLEFGKLVLPQVVETLLYNVVLVFCAVRGLGLTSFTIAVLSRGIFGVIILYWIAPWRPGFALSRGSLKGLLKFGIPYQLRTFISVFKDDGLTIVLGGILGNTGMGILGTADKLAKYPLRFFMDNVTRVMFPAFSRLQHDAKALRSAVTRSVFFTCFLVFPTTIGFVAVVPTIMVAIPQYSRWQPAILPLTLLAINTFFAAATTPLMNLLDAIGKIKISFLFTIFWTILTWALVPFLSVQMGVEGAALGYAIVGASSIFAIFSVYQYVPFDVSYAIFRPLLASLFMGVILLIIRSNLPATIYSLLLLLVIGAATYSATTFFFFGMALLDDVKKTFATVFAKK